MNARPGSQAVAILTALRSNDTLSIVRIVSSATNRELIEITVSLAAWAEMFLNHLSDHTGVDAEDFLVELGLDQARECA